MRDIRPSNIIAIILIIIGAIVLFFLLDKQSQARNQFNKEVYIRLNIAIDSESPEIQKNEIKRVMSYLQDHEMDQYSFNGSNITYYAQLEEISSSIKEADKNLVNKLRATKIDRTIANDTIACKYSFDIPSNIEYGTSITGYWWGYVISVILLIIGLIIFTYTYFIDENGYKKYH